ncbi:MAG: hypothetical protein NC403_08450 [Muribaculaceae bacterium]|nr:hypothetical protein [Muribaculaceae bacterium]
MEQYINTERLLNNIVAHNYVATIRNGASEWQVERIYNGNVKVTSYIASTHTPTGQFVFKPTQAKSLLDGWFSNGAELVNRYY